MDSIRNGIPGDKVAIVGIGCRFAGGIDSPGRFWEFLMAGESAVGPVPPDRWAAYARRSREHAAVLSRATANGAFMADISGFDNGFFGISATEARQLDPQQRVALEVAWEALEDAGIPPHTLAGTDAAVFMGVGSDDYGRRLLEDLPGIEAWTGIGASLCAVANRISYTLDLRGPSLAVDTACSSSLVALHQAVSCLLAGEAPVALAGGVMLMAGPGLTMVLDAAGAISPDGTSKAFDDAADGYGRGEGCGMVVLKRLSDAVHDGDRIIAVIRGSAVHQDGRTDGIMAPSRAAQEHLLRRAYASAGVDPRDVDYVEAHGTGTRVGDPVEAGALASVVGDRDSPCLVGSVKTNIGHTEAAAGVAGVIKTALAIRHGMIPPTRTTSVPRAEISWDGLRLVTEPVAWPETGRPRLAGVASYGYGGTIAHVVLEQGPPSVASGRPTVDGGPESRLFPVSAASPAGLAAQAARLADAIDGGPVELADVGHTLAHRRTHLPVRAVVAAGSGQELSDGLRNIAVGGEAARPVDPVWVFSGHGAQWSGMGRDLLIEEPVFAEVIDRLGPIYLAELGYTPRDVLSSGELGSVERIQSTIFAMQVGLAAVWRRYGVRPGAIIGHSVGEIAAAVVAGVLTEAEGARLVCRRSALLTRVAGRGAMVLVDLSFAEVEAELAGRTDITAAISAAPSSTVVSGDTPAIEKAAARWEELGRSVRRIDSDVAFHSEQMDALCADLITAAAGLAPVAASVPLYVTALGDPRCAPRQDAAYWAANLRNPVRFAEAVRAAAEDGHRVFLEISSHPVVSHSITETLLAENLPGGQAIPTLRRGKPERDTLLTGVARLHCLGVPVDWRVLQPAGKPVRLPNTVWQHTRHWVDGGPGETPPPGDTLLGHGVTVSGSGLRVWSTTLDLRTRPYPRRHPVLDTEIVPAAVLLSTLFEAGACHLAEIRLRQPVVVPPAGEPAREVQVVRDQTRLRIVSRALGGGEGDWTTHTLASAVSGDLLPVLRARNPAHWSRSILRSSSIGWPNSAWPTWVIRGGSIPWRGRPSSSWPKCPRIWIAAGRRCSTPRCRPLR
ncbi:type I polyketide synthase [Amycolatopsis sp. EV170708-02-1]|uniref:type I polyketide synthase n=1 Tax=Amycolatopsis sp. EV170708-02-1 TaxID=2919322 RepID=UPI001F0B72D3|nr:type I polyketide synthase [Amycolatopsis sp. EV170708-02-1]UMP01319.1 type I polyketide synthase [Amycolatopsis sp. EV170708-02-1]